MIKLDVQEYCHDCLYFEADVTSPAQYFAGNNVAEITDTIVQCENSNLCKNLVRHLRKKVETDGRSES